MSPRKAPDRIEKLARELQERENGGGVSAAVIGRDLAEIKLNLAYQDEEQRELRAILLGDGQDVEGVVPGLREVKRVQANFTKFAWLILTLVIGIGVKQFVKDHAEPPQRQLREERPAMQSIDHPAP